MGRGGWEGKDSSLARYLVDSNDRSLTSYASKPEWIEEHAYIEQAIAEGGYGHRQVYELVQNGADAMVNHAGGKIEVILTDSHLYCANEGDPIDQDGLGTLLGSNVSRKRGDEIGRFGLGFKSVLAVTATPEFFSKPVSLRFSRQFSEGMILGRVPDARGLPLPVLRLGEPLDPLEERENDPVLNELMRWSVTVVRLVLDPDRDTTSLKGDLANFPAEFLLFARHVSRLALDDRSSGQTRTISVQRGGNEVRLVEGTRDQRWWVFQRVVEPTPEARADAGARAERDRLPIDWAVPQGSSPIGKFWAFFPTTFETTLSGILNAPWKTNPDRENLLVGAFNEFLLEQAAELVVDNLHNVNAADDPGLHLDRMPARGREARGWADRRITERVYEIASLRASLPNQRGELILPASLRLHPEGVPLDALEQWSSYSFRPHDWVHQTVETRERRPRVERLLEASRVGAEAPIPAIGHYRDWLEALAEPRTVESSVAALNVARLLHDRVSPIDFLEVKQARIVLSSQDELVAPDPGLVFIGGRPPVPGTAEVESALLEDPFAEQILREIFGIRDVDRSAEFAAIVASANAGTDYWAAVWSRAGLIPVEQAKDVLLRYHTPGDIEVRNRAGNFRPLRSVLLPGPIVDASDKDAEYAIDEAWHHSHLELLYALGASDTPQPDRSRAVDDEPWYPEYLAYVRTCLKQAGQTVRANAVLESDHSVVPSHVEIVSGLAADARARLTAELLHSPATQQNWNWRQRGTKQDQSLAVLSPAAWMLRHLGMVLTTRGPQPASGAVASSLSDFSRVLPVARMSADLTSVLGLPEDLPSTPPDVLRRGLELLADETDDKLIGEFLSAIADVLDAPPFLRCRVGRAHQNRPPGEVTAIVSSEFASELRAVDAPVVLVPTQADADRLVERWGLRREGEIVTREIGFASSSPETPLVDEFPSLRLIPAMAAHFKVTLLRCSELTLTIRAAEGQSNKSLNRWADADRVYWLVQDLGDPRRDDGELLAYVSGHFGLHLSQIQIESLLKSGQDEAHRKRLEKVRSQADDIDRLLATLGPETVRRYVPNAVIDAVEQQGHRSSDRTIAEMALAVHGVQMLREARADLDRLGFQPPTQWAGGRPAQEFVRDLGFSREYAGFPSAQRDQVLAVPGPIELKDLHDFQAQIRDRLRALLRERGQTRRAMLSLPTGAGKTRVAVQSLVEHFVEGEIDGPVLWVAQSDELCEQAVQAWAEVWRAIGSPSELTISRLWDANSAEPIHGGNQVVVATIQKLDASVIGNSHYEWLSLAPILVVDEAHRGATEETTTRLFRWLGLEARGTDRCALVGLTATPFIGTNDQKTRTLVNRYGQRRLDTGLFPENDTEQLIMLLQQRRILSRARHEELEGAEVELSKGELEEFERFQRQRLPHAVEARLGVDAQRNQTLVKSIVEQPDAWQILVFAASVEHAQTLAALLRLQGVKAAAISGETDAGARRHYVQQFKDKKIRVLTNYGVLTTGFDAPEVRAVYIARPTYSPNLYLQMIGRGLRGPANGGTDECLIVDVKDNLRMYGGKLAFTDFEFLWSQSQHG